MASVSKTITVTMSDTEAADIMCTALEGGIGYWCRARDIQRVDDPSESLGWRYDSFVAEDKEEGVLVGIVTLDTIRIGANRILRGEMNVNSYLYNMVLANFEEDEPMDADGADCVVQAGLLGEVIYG